LAHDSIFCVQHNIFFLVRFWRCSCSFLPCGTTEFSSWTANQPFLVVGFLRSISGPHHILDWIRAKICYSFTV